MIKKDAIEAMKNLMPEESVRKSNFQYKQESLAVQLSLLRESMNIQQTDLPNFSQSAVSKLEHRKDLKVSTLVEYVNDLNMDVEIRAISRENGQARILLQA